MTFGHLHLGFQDLASAVAWMETVMDHRPVFGNGRMAVFEIGGANVIFDSAESDSAITFALQTESCDRDYDRLVASGAEPLEPPAELPWGVRAAYLKGPGLLTLELEQAIR